MRSAPQLEFVFVCHSDDDDILGFRPYDRIAVAFALDVQKGAMMERVANGELDVVMDHLIAVLDPWHFDFDFDFVVRMQYVMAVVEAQQYVKVVP
jgi:hypothetical protein